MKKRAGTPWPRDPSRGRGPNRDEVLAVFAALRDSGAETLSNLNDALRDRGYFGITAEGAELLGLVVRRRLTRAGRVRYIVVGPTREGVDAHWAFAGEW